MSDYLDRSAKASSTSARSPSTVRAVDKQKPSRTEPSLDLFSLKREAYALRRQERLLLRYFAGENSPTPVGSSSDTPTAEDIGAGRICDNLHKLLPREQQQQDKQSVKLRRFGSVVNPTPAGQKRLIQSAAAFHR